MLCDLSVYNFYKLTNILWDIDTIYELASICTRALAIVLKKVQIELKQINPNYSLMILDAYRPISAVEHIKRWAKDPNDVKTKVF